MSEEMQKVRRELSNIQDTSTRADSLSVRPSAGPLHDAGLVLHVSWWEMWWIVKSVEVGVWDVKYEGQRKDCSAHTDQSVSQSVRCLYLCKKLHFSAIILAQMFWLHLLEEPGQSHVSHLHQWGLTLSVSCSKRKVFSFQTVELKQSGDAGVFLEECTFSPALVWPLQSRLALAVLFSSLIWKYTKCSSLYVKYSISLNYATLIPSQRTQ